MLDRRASWHSDHPRKVKENPGEWSQVFEQGKTFLPRSFPQAAPSPIVKQFEREHLKKQVRVEGQRGFEKEEFL